MAALPDVFRRSPLTCDDVRWMEEQGLLSGRWELIEGELINKMGQNAPHSGILGFLTVWLIGLLGFRVRCQLPIVVNASDQRLNDPQPDIAVLREWKPEYHQRQPRIDELSLIIEVSDTSSRIDLSTKARLYARSGVPEYWVVDIANRRVVIHRQPEGDTYTQIEYKTEGQSLTLSGSELAISHLLSPDAID